MNKYYSVKYKTQEGFRGIWVSMIFGNKEKAEAFKEKSIEASINEVEIKNGYFILNRCGESAQYTDIESEDFIRLGDLRDSKWSYDYTAFCLREYKDEGFKAYDKEYERRKQRSDAYYSRPWV